MCARCTGLILGYVIGVLAAVFVKGFDCKWFWILLIPMLLDGFVQLLGGIESTNQRRLITGILAGIGIIYGFIFLHRFTLWWVTKFVKKFII